VLNRRDCLRHKSSLNFGFKQRRWTEEEDKKLLELYEQAVRGKKKPWPDFIANELGYRSFNAVKERLYVHRHGVIEYKPYRRWSQDEDSTIREKIQQGVSILDLPKYLPDRGLNSVKYRVRHLRTVTGITREIRVRRQEDFTEDQIQRAIHMRLREQKSHSEVAAEFNCSLSDSKRLWQYRCAPLLSKNDLDSFRDRNYWTTDQKNRLTELYTWTTLDRSDVALQFPSRTRHAVGAMIDRLQLPSIKKQRQAALKIEASSPTPFATPVTHQKSRQTLGGFEQRRMFSSSSYALYKRWSPDEDAKLLELRQQGLVSRDIAMVLEGRSVASVEHRVESLKFNPSTNTKRRWDPEEDAMLLEKMRHGLTAREISHLYPGRSFHSIEGRFQKLRLADKTYTKSGKPRRLTDAEIQLMIEMRLREHKTLREIATQLGRPYRNIQLAWCLKCAPLLSDEALRSIYTVTRNYWSEKELEHLAELYNRGNLTRTEIALHFPSRTKGAVQRRIFFMDRSCMGNDPSKTSEPKYARSRQPWGPSSLGELQPTRPTLNMPDSIQKTSCRKSSSR
jgi:hypothetical protein